MIAGTSVQRIFFVVALLSVVTVLACGGDSSNPVAPAPAPAPVPTAAPAPALSLTGTFSGNASDSSGPGRMTWVLSQVGASVSGTMTASTPSGTVQFRGNFAGTLSGTTLIFTIRVPAGGVSALPTCTIEIPGVATGVSSSSVSGTYSGTSTCTAPFNNGQFALARQ